MKNLNLFFLVIAVLAMVACGKKADSGKLKSGQLPASSTDSAEVCALFLGTAEPWNTGNLDPVAATLADNVIHLRPDTVICGKEALLADWSQYLADYVATWKPKVLKVASRGDMAFLTAEFTESAVPRSGGATRNINAFALEVYRRDASGAWKLVLESWYDNPLVVPSVVKGCVPVTGEGEQVKAVWNEYVAASGPALIENAIALLHEDVVQIPSEGNVILGKEALADKWRKLMKEESDYRWNPVLLDVAVAGDLGFVRYTGSEYTKVEGTFTTLYGSGWDIFRKDGDNGWKLIHEAWFLTK